MKAAGVLLRRELALTHEIHARRLDGLDASEAET